MDTLRWRARRVFNKGSGGTDDEQQLEVVRCIGRGTFSVVYEVRNKRTMQRLAMKRIFVRDMKDDKCRRDCINELALLKKLDHPNVVRYMGYRTMPAQGILEMILELADEGDLAAFVENLANKGQLMDERAIWLFAAQICAGLSHMHLNNVMHRDLKPANIFVTRGKVLKLGDLGLSKYFPTNTKSAWSVLGSPYYMSPERLMQEKYYFSSDVWSFGCVLYEIASLRCPFFLPIRDFEWLIRNVTTCSYPQMPYNTYSRELQNFVAECLALNAAERPSAMNLYRKTLDFL